MKIAIRAFVVLVLVLVVGMVVALLSLDGIAKGVVERQGSKAVGTAVGLDSISIRPIAGSAVVTGFSVANPEGYRAPSILRVERGAASVRLASLLSERPEVPEIAIDGVKVSIEQKIGSSNIKDLLAGMEAVKDQSPEASDGSTGDAQRFQVDRLVIRDIEVVAQLIPVGGGVSDLTFTIDEVEVADLDENNAQGLLMDELVGKVVGAVMVAVVEQLAIKAPGELVAGLGNIVDSLGVPGATMKIGGGVVEIGGGLIEGAGKAVQGAGEEIGGVLEGIGEEIGEGFGKSLEGAFGTAEKPAATP